MPSSRSNSEAYLNGMILLGGIAIIALITFLRSSKHPAPVVVVPSPSAQTAGATPVAQGFVDVDGVDKPADEMAIQAGATVLASAPPKMESVEVKVGVIVSHFSATGPSWMGNAQGFKWVGKSFREGLISDGLDLYPVVEAGTADESEIKEFCDRYFIGKKPIECTNDERMGELDVIVAPAVYNATPEMLLAVEKFVRDDGKGLLIRTWFGSMSPGFTPQVLALNGLKEGQNGWNPKNQPAKVVATHPILGDLSGKLGSTVSIEPNGPYGIHNGRPLLTVDSSVIQPVGKGVVMNRDDYVFAPLYVAEYGKGKIVGCCFLGSQNEPDTQRFVKTVMPRAIKWLAGKL